MKKHSILNTQNSKPNKGFTLIEILIVVAIIGLLSSVILVGLGSFRARGRDARRIADLREVQQALELYYLKNPEQKYPNADSWENLKTTLVNYGIGVSNIPNDPLSPDKTYQYGVDTANYQSYVLAAVLEEESPALKDVDGNLYGVECEGLTYCVRF